MRLCFNQLKDSNRVCLSTASVRIRWTHCLDFKLKTNEPSSAVVCQLLKRVNILLTPCCPLPIRLFFQLPFSTLSFDRRYINTGVGCFALLGDFSAEMGYYFYAPLLRVPLSTSHVWLAGWIMGATGGSTGCEQPCSQFGHVHFYIQLKA